LPESTVNTLLKRAIDSPGYRLTVDLENQTVIDEGGFTADFKMDAFRRHCLLNGLDDIGLTLVHSNAISEYEARRPEWRIPAAI
jgi:3-isopropylmalate/(R)-2-methylmalate dehydratase small subunit